MSMELMVKAMKIKVGNPLRKLVLLKLADNASDLGECWPSHQHIADQCEISKRSVIGHIKALAEMGLLRVEHRIKNNEKQSNIYHLTFDKKSSAGDSLPSAGDAQGGAGDSLPSSAGAAHRTSHSFEPVNEPSISSGDDESEKPNEPKSKYSEQFERWWAIYLKKTGKGDAWKIWKRDKLDSRADELVEKLKMINSMDYGFRAKEYVPMPATYLNGSRYDDEIQATTSTGGNNAANQSNNNLSMSPAEQVRAANAQSRAQRAQKA